MCGRYVSPEERRMESHWEIGRKSNPNPFGMRYNVAPTQNVPILLRARDAEVLELAEARWGLIPHWWSKPKPPVFSTINARSEEAASKPFWREPYRSARCIVPAVGWYEWQEGDIVKGKREKLPFYLRLTSGNLAAFAGLMSRWTNPTTGEIQLTCAILTRAPSISAAEVHDRMPVVLSRAAERDWLDSNLTDAKEVAEIIETGSVGDVVHHRVSMDVNRATSQGPELIVPIAGTS